MNDILNTIVIIVKNNAISINSFGVHTVPSTMG